MSKPWLITTVGWPSIWAFIAKTTDEFILGIAILHAYDMAVDLKHRVPLLGEQKALLMRPWGMTTTSSPSDVQQ
jgi:hypothetical protein